MTDYLLDHLGDLRTIGSAVDGGVPDGDPATAWDRRQANPHRRVNQFCEGRQADSGS